MENKHCNRCGEEYSSTYHKCPFCQEAAAERRGHPIYRRGRRLSQKQRSAGAGGVIKLVLLSITLIVVGVVLETEREIEAQLTMRHYKGFLE